MFTYCGNNPVNGIDPDGHARYRRAAAAAVMAVWVIPKDAPKPDDGRKRPKK